MSLPRKFKTRYHSSGPDPFPPEPDSDGENTRRSASRPLRASRQQTEEQEARAGVRESPENRLSPTISDLEGRTRDARNDFQNHGLPDAQEAPVGPEDDDVLPSIEEPDPLVALEAQRTEYRANIDRLLDDAVNAEDGRREADERVVRQRGNITTLYREYDREVRRRRELSGEVHALETRSESERFLSTTKKLAAHR